MITFVMHTTAKMTEIVTNEQKHLKFGSKKTEKVNKTIIYRNVDGHIDVLHCMQLFVNNSSSLYIQSGDQVISKG
jgi:hypothetical protein